MADTVEINIGANTRYIISTSGRLSSMTRYKVLLQQILKQDIAYIPINSGDTNNKQISPQRFIYALKGMPCIGGAISRDIKQTIVPYLDELDYTAECVKSVNTVIVKNNGLLKGYNTDVLGFKTAITNGIAVSGLHVKNAVCYGYGGVSSVVVAVLKELGFNVFLSGRNQSSINALATTYGIEVWTSDVDVDLFVNATPASEYPLDQAPNFLESIHKAKIAFDHEMPGKYLAQYCMDNNIFHIKGTEMYYPQMEIQWKLFLEGIVDPQEVGKLLRQAEGV